MQQLAFLTMDVLVEPRNEQTHKTEKLVFLYRLVPGESVIGCT